jgi:16S rRNA (cytosine1402-N4)-methyltransferase
MWLGAAIWAMKM